MEKISAMGKIMDFSLEILFPISCISCGKENHWICADCATKISLHQDRVCPVCEKTSTPDGRTCFGCKSKSSLSGLLVCASYKNDVLAKAVHLFKYRFISDIHLPLGQLAVKAMLDSEIPIPDAIVPIPLHPRRLRWRGFNQSNLLANHLAENLLPGTTLTVFTGALERKRYTQPQMGIKNFKERRKNIQNAFTVKDPENLTNKTILLVDDIATTGSTIFECARLLKDAGAREVFAIVIARQEFSIH